MLLQLPARKSSDHKFASEPSLPEPHVVHVPNGSFEVPIKTRMYMLFHCSEQPFNSTFNFIQITTIAFRKHASTLTVRSKFFIVRFPNYLFLANEIVSTIQLTGRSFDFKQKISTASYMDINTSELNRTVNALRNNNKFLFSFCIKLWIELLQLIVFVFVCKYKTFWTD